MLSLALALVVVGCAEAPASPSLAGTPLPPRILQPYDSSATDSLLHELTLTVPDTGGLVDTIPFFALGEYADTAVLEGESLLPADNGQAYPYSLVALTGTQWYYYPNGDLYTRDISVEFLQTDGAGQAGLENLAASTLTEANPLRFRDTEAPLHRSDLLFTVRPPQFSGLSANDPSFQLPCMLILAGTGYCFLVRSFGPSSTSSTNLGGTIKVRAFRRPPSCQTNLVRLSQGDARWGDTAYDHLAGATIRSSGCALTSLVMELVRQGVATDPGALHQVMLTGSGFDPGGIVHFGRTVPLASSQLAWNDLGRAQDTAGLRQSLCAGKPVVLGLLTRGGGTRLGHFVLATGIGPATPGVPFSEFRIADPRHINPHSTLGEYGVPFQVRGTVNATAGGAAAAALPAGTRVTFAGGTLLVTLSGGERIGSDPVTHQRYLDLAGSDYEEVELDNDADTLAPSAPVTSVAWLPDVVSGSLAIQVARDSAGTGTLAVMTEFGGGLTSHSAPSWLPVTFNAGGSRLVTVAVPTDSTDVPLYTQSGPGAPPQFSLHNACQRRFSARSSVDSVVAATWTIVGKPQTGALTLPARPSGQAYSATEFVVPVAGTVKLRVNNEPVAQANTSTTACP